MKKFPLTREEWDFENVLEGVPQAEIKVCYHYEFGRELASIVEAITKWRSFITGLIEPSTGESANELLKDQPLLISPENPVFLLNYPEWPKTPYFKIDSKTRTRRLKAFLPDEPTDEALAKCLEKMPLGIRNPQLGTEVTLVIARYLMHHQLQKAFAAYLRLKFPLQGKAKRGKKIKLGKAQGGAAEVRVRRNALRTLGVLRLQNAGIKAAEIEELIKNAKGRPLYHSESALNRAKALARRHIARFKLLATLSPP